MMKDNEKEMFPLVLENGNIIGSISRNEAHDGTKRLHPVVHLHVFNNRGELYLQKRPAWKDIQPNKWDTACGGHIDLGENVEDIPERIGQYVFESDREKELVYVHKTTYNEQIFPNAQELNGGRFWTKTEIENNLGKDIFTPNFESEYKRFFHKEE